MTDTCLSDDFLSGRGLCKALREQLEALADLKHACGDFRVEPSIRKAIEELLRAAKMLEREM